jgi:hypothetical protein
MISCRKCGKPITDRMTRFGSFQTGWEHMDCSDGEPIDLVGELLLSMLVVRGVPGEAVEAIRTLRQQREAIAQENYRLKAAMNNQARGVHPHMPTKPGEMRRIEMLPDGSIESHPIAWWESLGPDLDHPAGVHLYADAPEEETS